MNSTPSPDASGSDDLEQEIVVEITSSAAARASAEAVFNDYEVLTSRGFSGQDVVSIITKPTAALFKKLAAWLFDGAGKGARTKVKIGAKEISLEGFMADEVEHLLESPAFLKVLREARKK